MLAVDYRMSTWNWSDRRAVGCRWGDRAVALNQQLASPTPAAPHPRTPAPAAPSHTRTLATPDPSAPKHTTTPTGILHEYRQPGFQIPISKLDMKTSLRYS